MDWKRKLSSRKLWAALAGIVTGLAMVFGLDQDTISTVAGAVVSVASVVAYIFAEGRIDAAGVGSGQSLPPVQAELSQSGGSADGRENR